MAETEAGATTPNGPGGWLARKFRRVTSSGRYIPEVDGLRFLAIASVFLYHLRGYLAAKSSTSWIVPVEDDWLARAAHHGNAGVPLFFMVSGFILGLPFASYYLLGGKPVSLGAYFARRLTRLEPPYILSLTLFVILLRAVNHLPWRLLVPGYVTSFFYLHTLLGTPENTINAVGWSLEVEVQFYILAPLLARVFAVRGAALRRILIVALAYGAILAQWYAIDYRSPLYATVLNYIQYFLAGFLMADLHLVGFAGPAGQPRRFAPWDVAGIAALLAMSWVIPRPEWARFLAPALFLALMVATLRGGLVRRTLALPWVAAIGGMCYSIYLIHFQVISLVGRLSKDLPFTRYFWLNLTIQALVVGLPTLILSAAFFLAVEKPCMRKDWPARLLAWLRSLVSPPATTSAHPAVVPSDRT